MGFAARRLSVERLGIVFVARELGDDLQHVQSSRAGAVHRSSQTARVASQLCPQWRDATADEQ
jgi:hypothetical protein